MTRVPASVVVGVLVRDRRVLLVHRSPDRAVYPDVWDFPGGHREPGETAQEAVVRELREELAIEVAASALHECWHLVDGEFDLRAWFVAEWVGTTTNAAPDEHDQIGWFSFHEARALSLADPRYGAIIEQVLDA
jgi:8-oxo-dGTP diphosphatase